MKQYSTPLHNNLHKFGYSYLLLIKLKSNGRVKNSHLSNNCIINKWEFEKGGAYLS